MNWSSIIFHTLFGSAILLLLFGIVVVIPKKLDYESRMEVYAREKGCELIGQARGLSGVWFLKCGDEVRIVYNKHD